MKIPPWLLVLLSFGLYVVACAAPALMSVNPSGKEEPLTGIFCLIWGIMGIAAIWPPLCWIANPWVFILWINVLRRRKSGPAGAWGGLLFAVFALVFLRFLPEYAPQIGAYLWLTSIALAGWAAHLTDQTSTLPLSSPRPRRPDEPPAPTGR